MNGFESVGYNHDTSEWSDLPIVMIASRSMARHRQNAEAAGVSRFIARPSGDDEALDCIEAGLADPA